jgi:hypothetical protein
MTAKEPMGSRFFASMDRSRGQMVSFVFGALMIGASLLVFILFEHYAIGQTFTPSQQLERNVLLATRYSVALLALAAYLVSVGGLFLMHQRSLTLPLLVLIVGGIVATVMLGMLFPERFPAIIAAPLILVFMLIAPGNVLGRFSFIVGAAVLMGVVILIGILRTDLGVSVESFTHEGREYYLLVNNSVSRFTNDYSRDDEGLYAYSCDGTMCTLVYPCEPADSACLDRAVVREAWGGP